MIDCRRATRLCAKGLMINVNCTRCGVVNILSNEICRACGLELSPSLSYSATPRAHYAEVPRRSSPLLASIGPFNSIGDVLGPAITIFAQNFWLISRLVIVVATPFEIFKALSARPFGSDWQLTVGTFALQSFCNVLITPALMYALMKVLQTGDGPGINEAYRWGLGRLGMLVCCAIMAWVLIGVGFVFLIIPGIFLLAAFELVYPVAVFEDGSPTEILDRSFNLTKGHRWKILGAMILMSVITGLIGTTVRTFASIKLGGAGFPAIQVLAAVFTDIIGQGGTVLSLVIYLSILRTLESRQSF